MTKYIQYKDPDAVALRDLINKVRGERSMAKFADDIKLTSPSVKVSAPTLSRACNWTKGSSPVSIELLQAIAAIALPESGVTLDALVEANGMMTKEQAVQNSKRRTQQVFAERQLRRKEMRGIITDELFARGIAIKKLGAPDKAELNHSKAFFGAMICDLAITLPEEKEYLEWGFSMISVSKDEDPDEDYPGFYIRRVIDNYAVIFLQDAWEPENTKDIKHSFAFIDPFYYTLFIDTLQVAKFNNRMSAILIDIKEKKVIKEHVFPCKNFPGVKSLFENQVHPENNSENEDTYQFTFLEDFNG